MSSKELTEQQKQVELNKLLSQKRRTDPFGLLKAQRDDTLAEYLAEDLAKLGLSAVSRTSQVKSEKKVCPENNSSDKGKPETKRISPVTSHFPIHTTPNYSKPHESTHKKIEPQKFSAYAPTTDHKPKEFVKPSNCSSIGDRQKVFGGKQSFSNKNSTQPSWVKKTATDSSSDSQKPSFESTSDTIKNQSLADRPTETVTEEPRINRVSDLIKKIDNKGKN